MMLLVELLLHTDRRAVARGSSRVSAARLAVSVQILRLLLSLELIPEISSRLRPSRGSSVFTSSFSRSSFRPL